MVGVQKHGRVTGGKPELPCVLGRLPVVARDDAGDGLLLQPLLCVPRIDSGPGREFVARGACGPERRVQAEPQSEIHGHEFDARERTFEQARRHGLDPHVVGGI